MPTDTCKGHGFRNDMFDMVKTLKPSFIRFPGGCFVEGEWLRNAFCWKGTIGPWEERPRHFGDVWHYWTDDGLGHFEFFQVQIEFKVKLEGKSVDAAKQYGRVNNMLPKPKKTKIVVASSPAKQTKRKATNLVEERRVKKKKVYSPIPAAKPVKEKTL